MRWFILNKHGQPVECDSVLDWVRWAQQRNGKPLSDESVVEWSHPDRVEPLRPVLARNATASSEVTTKFLGTPAGHRRGLPLLFETVILGGQFDGERCRYASMGEATIGHWSMVLRAGGLREDQAG